MCLFHPLLMSVVRGTKHAAAASYTPVVLPFRNQLLWGSLSSSRSSSTAPSSTGPRTTSLLPTLLWGISCRCCTESGSAGHDPRLHWHPDISSHQLHVQAERGRASGQRHAHAYDRLVELVSTTFWQVGMATGRFSPTY